MDDLRAVRELLEAPGPTVRSTVQARNRLTAAIRPSRPARRPSHRWQSQQRSIVSAAALAGVVLAVGVLVPGPAQHSETTTTPAPAALSPQNILRAAASRAEEESGRYWHVQLVGLVGPYTVGTAPHQYKLLGRNQVESWIARDPHDVSWEGNRQLGFRPLAQADQQAWRAAGAPRHWGPTSESDSNTPRLTMTPSKPELEPIDTKTTYLHDFGGTNLTQLQQLPTDPARLRELFLERLANERPAPNSSELDALLFESMTQLLLDVPAPPKVRAAAFAVLAEIPGIHATGEVRDGQGRSGLGVELTRTRGGMVEYHRLVFDARRHLILARDDTFRYGERTVKEQHLVVLISEWTDQKPRALTPVP